MFKRLLPIAGIVGLLAIALAGSAAAGGGGGYGTPGLFKFSDWSANASITDATGNFYGSVYVDRGMQSFKLKHTPGAPVVERPGTVLNVSDPSGYGCWIIPDSAFVAATDLSGASLNIHATPGMVCPGLYVGSATGGKPGLQSALGFGGGGPPPNLITDITVNLTWAGSGALWTNTNSGNSKCMGYVATFHGSFDYEFATATGTVGDEAVSDPLAQVAHSTQTNNANTTVPAACNPYGF
ncbi:MAG: hypothetical protein QOH92_1266 [Chloroflexota bacterium]|jgi:hypothetical protein|nr:hypothetical protein [Chloroflexota bacterium]